jgi:hypothetical protein
MKSARHTALVLVALVSLPAAAAAQFAPQAAPPSSRERHWGLTGSIAPWQAGDQFKALYDARALDLAGRDLRIGVTRGSSLGNEWALLFVKRRIDEGATLGVFGGETYVFRPGVELTGFMGEAYGALVTIKRRAQIGGVVAGGLARAKGFARRTSGLPDAPIADVLTLFARTVPFQLLARAELAVAFRLAPGAKLRFSGGFDWPGTTVVGVTMMYFFGDR